jgi:hypothetical protein
MNLEVVSVETPRLAPTQPSPHGELKRKAPLGNDCRVEAERGASEVLLKKVLIEIALEKIAAQGLCGAEPVGQYLMDLFRRNCCPNVAALLPVHYRRAIYVISYLNSVRR